MSSLVIARQGAGEFTLLLTTVERRLRDYVSPEERHDIVALLAREWADNSHEEHTADEDLDREVEKFSPGMDEFFRAASDSEAGQTLPADDVRPRYADTEVLVEVGDIVRVNPGFHDGKDSEIGRVRQILSHDAEDNDTCVEVEFANGDVVPLWINVPAADGKSWVEFMEYDPNSAVDELDATYGWML